MIDSIGAGETQQTDQSTTQASIGQEEFLNILLTQLTFQDPLKPLDNQEFIAQMAQFTSLEQTRQMSENTEVLLTVQSASQAIALIDKTVTIATDGGAGTAKGTVSAVRFQQGIPELTVQVAADDFIENIRLAEVINVTSI